MQYQVYLPIWSTSARKREGIKKKFASKTKKKKKNLYPTTSVECIWLSLLLCGTLFFFLSLSMMMILDASSRWNDYLHALCVLLFLLRIHRYGSDYRIDYCLLCVCIASFEELNELTQRKWRMCASCVLHKGNTILDSSPLVFVSCINWIVVVPFTLITLTNDSRSIQSKHE